MPAFNFSPQFADAVAAGRKLNTIREKQRGKVGDPAYLFTGQRTKKCVRLGEGTLVRVEKSPSTKSASCGTASREAGLK